MLSAIRGLGAGRFPLMGLPLSRLIPGLNLLLVALLSYALAQLTWLLLQGRNDNPGIPAIIVPEAISPKVSTSVSLETIAALHLLGRSDEIQSASIKAPINAPETRLNLTLRGLVALSSQEGALAIIAQGGGEENAYKVGDKVPGGAVLHEIHADRVILERGGRFETLTLPKDKTVMAEPPAQTRLPSAGGRAGLGAGPSVDVRQLQAIRDTIQNNPQEAMQLVNAQPVMDGGQLKGYRLNPGRDRKLFNSVGLRPGDIVTSVNGIPLNDMSQMGALFEQLNSANRLDITLERGGRQRQLSLSLD